MRKLLPLALALGVAMAASAERPQSMALTQKLSTPHAITNQAFEKNSRIALKGKPAIKERASRSEEAPITDPAGEKQFCKVTAEGYTYSYDYGIMWQTKEVAGYIVRNENTLYIGDPVSDFAVGSYIQGTISGNEAYFEFPQLVAYDADWGEAGYVSIMEAFEYTSEYTGQIYKGYRPVADADNHATYILNEDGSVELVSPSPDYDSETYFEGEIPELILGIYFQVDEEVEELGDEAPTYWYQCGDIRSLYTPYDIEAELVHVPDGVKLENWIIGGLDYSPSFVQLGFDGDDVYLVGVLDYLPDAAVKGKVTETGLSFPTCQLLGYIEKIGMFAYFCPMDYDWNEFVDLELEMWDGDELSKFAAPEGEYSLVYTTSDNIEAFAYYDYIDDPYLKNQGQGVENANPQDPEYLGYEDSFFDIDGSTGLTFYTPTTNVNGYQMPASRMYYNLYINGELFVFDADTYWMDEDLVDVPFDLDQEDIFDMGEEHMVYVYVYGIETVGIQTFFNGTDGRLYASNLLTYTLDGELIEITDGQISTNVSAKEIMTQEFYNLNGMRIEAAATGLYIERTIFTDGSSISRKVIR